MDTTNSTLALRRKLAALEFQATWRRENLEDLVHSARFVAPRLGLVYLAFVMVGFTAAGVNACRCGAPGFTIFAMLVGAVASVSLGLVIGYARVITYLNKENEKDPK